MGISRLFGEIVERRVRNQEGDQAYAPFGAGRETGHQVPVVAAKKKAFDIESWRTPYAEEKKGKEGGRRGLITVLGKSWDFSCAIGAYGDPESVTRRSALHTRYTISHAFHPLLA